MHEEKIRKAKEKLDNELLSKKEVKQLLKIIKKYKRN